MQVQVHSSSGNAASGGSGRPNLDYFTSEFEINDSPAGARKLLTKGFIQDEISRYSGAAISTRGRYLVNKSSTERDRPLYLFIQGPTERSIQLAIQKIHEIIRNDIGASFRLGSGSSTSTGSNTTPSSISNNIQPCIERVYVGLDGVPPSFDLKGKIIGQDGSNFAFIRSETGANVTLCGGSEVGAEPLHILLEHSNEEGLHAAKLLAGNLIETLAQELHQIQFQQMNMPPPPLQGGPNGIIVAGPQLQAAPQIEQMPPPVHINIPPPGVHIPQHLGPLVPPPPAPAPVPTASLPPPTPYIMQEGLVYQTPPQQMIITTHLQVDPSAPPPQQQPQIGDQQQQQQQKFHIIGQLPNHGQQYNNPNILPISNNPNPPHTVVIQTAPYQMGVPAGISQVRQVNIEQMQIPTVQSEQQQIQMQTVPPLYPPHDQQLQQHYIMNQNQYPVGGYQLQEDFNNKEQSGGVRHRQYGVNEDIGNVHYGVNVPYRVNDTAVEGESPLHNNVYISQQIPDKQQTKFAMVSSSTGPIVRSSEQQTRKRRFDEGNWDESRPSKKFELDPDDHKTASAGMVCPPGRSQRDGGGRRVDPEPPYTTWSNQKGEMNWSRNPEQHEGNLPTQTHPPHPPVMREQENNDNQHSLQRRFWPDPTRNADGYKNIQTQQPQPTQQQPQLYGGNNISNSNNMSIQQQQQGDEMRTQMQYATATTSYNQQPPGQGKVPYFLLSPSPPATTHMVVVQGYNGSNQQPPIYSQPATNNNMNVSNVQQPTTVMQQAPPVVQQGGIVLTSLPSNNNNNNAIIHPPHSNIQQQQMHPVAYSSVYTQQQPNVVIQNQSMIPPPGMVTCNVPPPRPQHTNIPAPPPTVVTQQHNYAVWANNSG